MYMVFIERRIIGMETNVGDNDIGLSSPLSQCSSDDDGNKECARFKEAEKHTRRSMSPHLTKLIHILNAEYASVLFNETDTKYTDSEDDNVSPDRMKLNNSKINIDSLKLSINLESHQFNLHSNKIYTKLVSPTYSVLFQKPNEREFSINVKFDELEIDDRLVQLYGLTFYREYYEFMHKYSAYNISSRQVRIDQRRDSRKRNVDNCNNNDNYNDQFTPISEFPIVLRVDTYNHENYKNPSISAKARVYQKKIKFTDNCSENKFKGKVTCAISQEATLSATESTVIKLALERDERHFKATKIRHITVFYLHVSGLSDPAKRYEFRIALRKTCQPKYQERNAGAKLLLQNGHQLNIECEDAITLDEFLNLTMGLYRYIDYQYKTCNNRLIDLSSDSSVYADFKQSSDYSILSAAVHRSLDDMRLCSIEEKKNGGHQQMWTVQDAYVMYTALHEYNATICNIGEALSETVSNCNNDNRYRTKDFKRISKYLM